MTSPFEIDDLRREIFTYLRHARQDPHGACPHYEAMKKWCFRCCRSVTAAVLQADRAVRIRRWEFILTRYLKKGCMKNGMWSKELEEKIANMIEEGLQSGEYEYN